MSRPTADLGPDAVVGAYRLVREIGCGGMARVYEARHSVLPRRAAIKVMHAELRKQPGMATRVVQEASILEGMHHPGVVRVFECALLPDLRPWIAMELVEGETLASRLAHQGVLQAAELAELLAEIAEVLAAVHARGVVHRDLKPDNILLTPADAHYPLRVIDWGVARLGPLGRLTLDGLTPGTPIYMSPEQATARDIGPPCDVYALGVIAYEMLTGRPPFDGRTLAEVVSMHIAGDPAPLYDQTRAPPELCELVHRMLAKTPATRPTATEVCQLARSCAIEASYESFEIITGEPRPAKLRPQRALAVSAPPSDDEVEVVDPQALELAVTPAIHKPRWTPELACARLARDAAGPDGEVDGAGRPSRYRGAKNG